MSRRVVRAALLALSVATTAACGMLPHAVAVPQTSAVAAALGLKSSASALRLFTLPDAGDGIVESALRNARSSIRMEVYLLTDVDVINELVAARARGVNVQVILEASPYGEAQHAGKSSRTAPTNVASAVRLKAAGITVAWGAKTFAYTHAKVVTIDNSYTLVSTANFTRTGLDADGDGSREYIIEDRTPADVAEFGAIFAADRVHALYQPKDPDLVVSPDNSRAKLFALLAAARHEATIQVEIAGDPALDALIAAKVKAGVQVRALLSTGGSNAEAATAWTVAGAQVRYQTTPHLHGKAIVIDGEVLYIGSENLSTGSLDHNRELGLLTVQADIISHMQTVFEHDWAKGISPAAKPKKKKQLGVAPDPGGDTSDDPTDTDDDVVNDDDDAIGEDPI